MTIGSIKMTRLVFGNESAIDDPLLDECNIRPPSIFGHETIFRGRWGTGKTATILLKNKKLSDCLREISPDLEYSWYLNEAGLTPDGVFSLRQCYKGNDNSLKLVIENLWRSEIIRIYTILLSNMRAIYDVRGEHWDNLSRFHKKHNLVNTVWQNIPTVQQSERAAAILINAVSDFLDRMRNQYSTNIESCIQKCLEDIKHYDVQPCVAIEPIETPESPIEQQDSELAQQIIVSLINLYQNKYAYSEKRRQFMRIMISIPWHRSIHAFVREPQKLTQYEALFRWSKLSLREFINKRINWELDHVRRHVTRRHDIDDWSILFPENVRNKTCHRMENSFGYLIRHTHHRARDVQRLARYIVESQVRLSRDRDQNISIDHVLSGQNREKGITPTAVIDGVREGSKKSSEDRIEEASRRYSLIRTIMEHFRGVSVPLTFDDFEARLGGENVGGYEAGDMLWEAGIIGLCISPKTEKAKNDIKSRLGDDCRYEFSSLQGKLLKTPYFLFEYNCSDEKIEKMLLNYPDCDVNIVFHPMFFESFGMKITSDFPIGI